MNISDTKDTPQRNSGGSRVGAGPLKIFVKNRSSGCITRNSWSNTVYRQETEAGLQKYEVKEVNWARDQCSGRKQIV